MSADTRLSLVVVLCAAIAAQLLYEGVVCALATMGAPVDRWMITSLMKHDATLRGFILAEIVGVPLALVAHFHVEGIL